MRSLTPQTIDDPPAFQILCLTRFRHFVFPHFNPIYRCPFNSFSYTTPTDGFPCYVTHHKYKYVNLSNPTNCCPENMLNYIAIVLRPKGTPNYIAIVPREPQIKYADLKVETTINEIMFHYQMPAHPHGVLNLLIKIEYNIPLRVKVGWIGIRWAPTLAPSICGTVASTAGTVVNWKRTTRWHHSSSIRPESQHPESQHPKSKHPKSQHPKSQHPESQHPESQHPESQHPESQHPESQHPVCTGVV